MEPNRFAILILLSGLLVSSMSARTQVPEAELLISQATDAVLVVIDEAQAYVDDDPERFYTAVEAVLRPVIDFPRFARSVMAAHYKDATAEQQARFSDGFKWSLVRTYALALTEFSDGEVAILPSERPPRRADRASVKQEIRSSGEVYPVVYSLALSDGTGWRVRNIIINGINMGLTYRNQFASAVNDPEYGGDMDRIIDGWIASLGRESEAAPAAAQTAPAAAQTEAAVQASTAAAVAN